MHPITFDQTSYRLNGQPLYLYSGEIHYFRTPRSDWRRRMELLKEAGAQCVATYVPWLIHEPEEGHFIFDDVPWRQFEAFLQTALEVGLYVLARPGPYQYSELIYSGLPGWLCENYPELRAHDAEGKPYNTSAISYLHPLFLEKTRRWFDQVGPILARYSVSRGGPIAFTQIDNEMTGIQIWNDHLDYNVASMGWGRPDGRYPRFLSQRYNGQINVLNRRYATAYASFEAVRPPAESPADDLPMLRRQKDYFDFYLHSMAEYAQTLAGWLRQYGIDTPIVHNSGTFNMNAYFLDVMETLGPDFLLGSDHYYTLGPDWAQNNPTPQYAVKCFYSNEMLRLLGFPPTVMELPGGSLSDFPPFTASDADACYRANLALGMKGHNYYIFTGGPNPPHYGRTGEDYDYGAAISSAGEVRPLYQTQKELGRFLAEQAWLTTAHQLADCRLAFDFEMVRSEYYWKRTGDWLLGSRDAWNFIRQGLLTSAFAAGLSPAFCDLRRDDWLADTSQPVMLAVSSSLGADKQERVIRFLRQGGRLLLAPVIPTLDENFEPCTLLADYLGVTEVRPYQHEAARLNIEGVVNILRNGPVFVTSALPAGATILGGDELSGQTVAWEVSPSGGGQVVFVGFGWQHARLEHGRMLHRLLQRLGVRPLLSSSNPNVWAVARASGSQCGVFLLNLHSSPMETEVFFHGTAGFPAHDLGRHSLPPMTVKFLVLPALQESGSPLR